MGTKLVRLGDGVLVEVQAPESEMQQISGNRARAVDAAFDQIKPLLLKISQPVLDAVNDMRDQVNVEQVEIELGLSFESGGTIYIAQAKASSNLNVKMTLKNK